MKTTFSIGDNVLVGIFQRVSTSKDSLIRMNWYEGIIIGSEWVAKERRLWYTCTYTDTSNRTKKRKTKGTTERTTSKPEYLRTIMTEADIDEMIAL